MSSHGQCQQKKLAKKKAKRAEKRSQIARQANPGISFMFQMAADWPIVEAMMPDAL